MTADTIYGLSSGTPPAGVAVIRVSGQATRLVVETLVDSVPEPRLASLRTIRGPSGAIDHGLVLFFPAPASFTGEDVAELQVHGGRAVVEAVFGAIAAIAGTRPAEAGEFTRRAFLNRRLDLSQVEGLADLVRAETEAQRRQALVQASGGLRATAEGWRERLLRARALVEAELDFGEDEGISVAAEAARLAGEVRGEIEARLHEARNGLRVREGLSVVLLGAPNAGKSSLLNALARSEVAIVTPEPGTTRDLIEVPLNLGGYAVTVIDTAGLREAAGLAEAEGVRRARERAERADVVVWLEECGRSGARRPAFSGELIAVASKADLIDSERERQRVAADFDLMVSTRTSEGVEALTARLGAIAAAGGDAQPALVTRIRQVRALEDCAGSLGRAGSCGTPEIIAEELRAATESVGRLMGRVDVEEVLGQIFAEFCIGK